MLKFRLFHLLKKLNSSEFSHLDLFVKSPFFNKSSELISLFTYIITFQPSFSSHKLTKESMFNAVWPDESYSMKRITNLMHNASKLVEDFMAQMEIKNDKKLSTRVRANAFHTRKMTEEYKGQLNNLNHIIKDQPSNGIASLSEALMLYDEQFGMISNRSDNAQSYMEKPVEWVKELEKLTDLKFIIEGFSHSEVRDSDLQKKRLDNLLNRILPIETETSLVQTYYKLLECYKQPTIEKLTSCFDYFKENHTYSSQREQRTIFISMANIAIKISNTGDLPARTLGFNIYRFAFDHDIALDQNSLTEMTFTNVVLIGSSIGEYEYVKYFIEKYSTYLPEKVQNNAVSLSTAYLLFNQNEYQKSIAHLNSVQFTNDDYKIRAKILGIRAAYAYFLEDEDNFDHLLSHTNSFYKFVYRSTKILLEKKSFFLDYSSLLVQIARLRKSRRNITSKKQLLLQKIQDKKAFLMKEMLLDEVNQLS